MAQARGRLASPNDLPVALVFLSGRAGTVSFTLERALPTGSKILSLLWRRRRVFLLSLTFYATAQASYQDSSGGGYFVPFRPLQQNVL